MLGNKESRQSKWHILYTNVISGENNLLHKVRKFWAKLKFQQIALKYEYTFTAQFWVKKMQENKRLLVHIKHLLNMIAIPFLDSWPYIFQNREMRQKIGYDKTHIGSKLDVRSYISKPIY